MSIWFFIPPIFILLCVATCWFFANSEMAMVSSNKIKLDNLAKSGDTRAVIIVALLNNPERLFGTTLVGTNVASIISTVISDYYFQTILQEPLKTIGVGTVIPLDAFISCIMVPLVLIFGELYPMYVARKYPNATALRNAKLIKVAYLILYPLMLVVSNISKGIGKLLKSDSNQGMTRDELEMLVVGKSANIPTETKKIISDVFDINEITAEDVMVHLNQVVAINEKASVAEYRKLIKKYQYNRIPVYQDNIFNITGTVHPLNVIDASDQQIIGEFKDKLYIVPSTKAITQILSELKRNRKYMGVVVDEFGAACGVLTLEDIIDQIMPKVSSPLLTGEKKLVGQAVETNIYDARMTLDEFKDATGVDLINEDVETLGGLVNLALGHIGRRGEKVNYNGVEFEIVDSTDRVVNKVKFFGEKDKEEA